MLVDSLLKQFFTVLDFPDSLGLCVIELELKLREFALRVFLHLFHFSNHISKGLRGFLEDSFFKFILFNLVILLFN